MLTARPVSIFDLDGTVSDRDLFVSFLLYILRRDPVRLFRAGHLPVFLFLRKIGVISTDELKRVFTLAIVGRRDRARVEQLASEFANHAIGSYIRPRARAVLEESQQRGDLLILATASLDLYAEPIGRLLGFDHVIATRCRWDSADRLAGDCLIANLKGQAKLDAVRAIVDLRDGAEWAAYSDSLEDAPLLSAAHRGVFVGQKHRNRAKQLGFQLADWS